MRPAVGGRAIAVRNANDDTVFLYGYGVYVGPQPKPGTNPDVVDNNNRVMYEKWASASQLDRDLEFMVKDTEDAVVDGKISRADADPQIADLRAKYATELALGLEGRILLWHRRAVSNPKIVLDSGDTIWGFQCWWTSEEEAEQFIGGRAVEVVPVPDGNPREPH